MAPSFSTMTVSKVMAIRGFRNTPWSGGFQESGRAGECFKQGPSLRSGRSSESAELRLTAQNRFATIKFIHAQSTRARNPSLRRKTAGNSQDFGQDFRGKGLSSHFGARHLTGHQNEPVRPVLLFHDQRRAAVFDPGALFR